MTTAFATTPSPVRGVEKSPDRPDPDRPPPLVNGDRLTRDEFERRYAAMPETTKAELIDGRVYLMASPVSRVWHGRPHYLAVHWLATYEEVTPGVEGGDNTTVRLDLDNEPQPDIYLRILPECGGQTTDDGDYVGGAPELVVEIAGSTASYDLHEKLDAYRRNGVKEYIVWTTHENELRWFVLHESRYEGLAVEGDGRLRSVAFPGLWLDPQALLAGDLKQVRAAVMEGTATPEHHAFLATLRADR